MEEILKELFEADDMLNRIAVSGESVFLLTNARTKISRAFNELKKVSENDTNTGNDSNA